MVDNQYAPTQVSFKSQDLMHIFKNLIIPYLKNLVRLLQVFINPSLIPGQSLSQTVTPTS
jgi:hypothetical protein